MSCCLPEFPDPIHLLVFHQEVKQLSTNHGITQCSGRRGAVPCRILRAWRQLQDLADRLDTKHTSFDNVVFVHVTKDGYIVCWRPGYAPKKFAARLIISFARFNSRFSCSKRRISSNPSEVTPPMSPSSMSACLIQDQTDSTP